MRKPVRVAVTSHEQCRECPFNAGMPLARGGALMTDCSRRDCDEHKGHPVIPNESPLDFPPE